MDLGFIQTVLTKLKVTDAAGMTILAQMTLGKNFRILVQYKNNNILRYATVLGEADSYFTFAYSTYS